jgi:hypothetical protein
LSALPPVVFVTYARQHAPAQIGVLKRVLRLARHLTGRYDITLLHFGFVPDDPLIAETFPSLRVRIATDEAPASVEQFLARLAPRYVVFGEAPLSGILRRVYRIAEARRLRQAAIDNYYGDIAVSAFCRGWPAIDRWLLLGLEDRRAASGDVVVDIVPPLLDPPRGAVRPRRGVTVLGYDGATLESAMELLERLPRSTPATVYTVPPWIEQWSVWSAARRRPITVSGLPTDDSLSTALAESALVVCKNGFQQMIEALLLGAPVVARTCTGGVAAELLPEKVRRWVRYVDGQDVRGVLLDASLWVASPARLPWTGLAEQGAAGTGYAASRLVDLLGT